ncbi:hypothetical protein [Yersinia phage vB_YenM_P778]
MQLTKIDYHDILNNSMYYILHSETLKREHISKDAFYQIVNAAKDVKINSYPWEQCTTNEYFLTF